jgi:hypothetical protein
MTNPPRPTASTINDEQLDQLYADLAWAEAEAASADASASSHADRANTAEATLANVRTLRDDLRATTGARYIADALDTILNGEQPPPGPAAPRSAGTRDHRFTLTPEEERAASDRARRVAAEAQRASEQLAALATHTGLVVQPYRTDRGDPAWVFRCWGTDTCDGWLSLDHSSQQSAERARDRHVAEAHPAGPCPACRRADQAGLAPTEQHDDCAKEQH